MVAFSSRNAFAEFVLTISVIIIAGRITPARKSTWQVMPGMCGVICQP